MCSDFSWIVLLVCFSKALSCPPGWTLHGSSCYHFSHDKEQWEDAVGICQILGGHLVEIEDSTENEFITNQVKLANQNFWIGLNDLQEEGTWMWAYSRTKATFTGFGSNRPDNYGNNENCVDILPEYHFQWNDAPCSFSNHYICEKPAGCCLVPYGICEKSPCISL